MTDASRSAQGPMGLFANATSALLVGALGLALTTAEAKADGNGHYDKHHGHYGKHHDKEKFQKLVRKIFTKRIRVEAVRKHQKAWQKIADRNNGSRVSGLPGYDESVDYVVRKLKYRGYQVTRQEFEFFSSIPVGPSALAQIAPAAKDYLQGTDFDNFAQTDAGDVTGVIQGVDLALEPPQASTSGCEADDFTGFTGDIALMQRGACTFQLKAENAAAAGATAAIIFNQGNTPEREGLINGTLGATNASGIPVLEATFPVGVELAEATEARVFANVFRGLATAENVIADLRPWPHQEGKPVIVLGAHLDSVAEGPGIQDNGSGSGAILEIARKLRHWSYFLKNRVRFAWWGAEESGLVGSQFYVDNLTDDERAEIFLNLNFDMIGSPNFVPFVYDGDGSDTEPAGPPGSEIIEQAFNEAILDRGFTPKPTQFSGRSDYGPFIAVGIPAGGLFTGAEGIKTDEEETIYGGIAGEQYDQCYHLACDTFDNISLTALELNSKVAADVMLQFAFREEPLTPPAAPLSAFSASSTAATSGYDFEYLGSHFRK